MFKLLLFVFMFLILYSTLVNFVVLNVIYK